MVLTFAIICGMVGKNEKADIKADIEKEQKQNQELRCLPVKKKPFKI
jgi:hypothetical protein